MHMTTLDENVFPAKGRLSVPLCLTEWGYYFVMLYLVVGTPLGLAVGQVGSGYIMVALLVLCVFEMGSCLSVVTRLVWPALGCGVSYLLIQILIHNESLGAGYVRNFGPWILSLIIVQSLALRNNFLHRFAFVNLLIGCTMLPYISAFTIQQRGTYERIGLDFDAGVGYANPNDMAAWFGFCTVYFTIRGYIASRTDHRILCWLVALGSLYILTLTVSRGALLAVGIAVLLASRHLLKTGFIPLLLLICLSWIVVELGIFDNVARFYGLRLGEDTNRLHIWPMVIERFMDSPLVGVGASSAGVVLYGGFITPHNGFLFLAIASGIIPFTLFIAHWIRSAKAALYPYAKGSGDAAFHMPLLIYTALIVSTTNLIFMAPWAIVSVAAPIAGNAHRKFSYRATK
jgi:O-antigen ligase/polysaccharide polymerase Wzy-like membrane protein